MKRRTLLWAGPSALVALFVGKYLWPRGNKAHPVALAGEGKLSAQMLPATPGAPSPEQLDALWALAGAAQARWGMKLPDRATLEAAFQAKAQLPPSYLAEYDNALQLVLAAGREGVSQLLAAALALPGAALWRPRTRLSHLRKFVVDELVQLLAVEAVAPQLGMQNYRGWIAGTFAYRKAGTDSVGWDESPR